MHSPEEFLPAYQKAVWEKDVEAFAALFDPAIHVFDMWGRWSFEGLPAWKEMAKGWLGSLGADRCQVEFQDTHLETSGDLAWLTTTVTFRGVDPSGKELRSLQERMTAVIRRKNGDWKVVHGHHSGPIDHSTLKVILKKT
ncbi:MAG TPA: nuclear transport factor 2 family protein [bacterium]|nr:nuclear transport factor 2 family protein [bacterium]